MAALQSGFGRIDITPAFGTTLAGYYEERRADGILDPLLATAVAFDDGEKRTVVISMDIIGIGQQIQDRARTAVAERIGTAKEGVFICCTHTHLGPCTMDSVGKLENEDYIDMMIKKLCDVADLAVQDLAPTQMSYTRGVVDGVAFVRRFKMKDGTVRTNPGCLNPQIDHPLGTPDENSALVILKREGKPEIGIVNFQVHPDVIGGCKVSADYPKFVRDTYERHVPNSRCMYINGAQGDTNHIDVSLDETWCRGGYRRSKYMGEKIAMSVLCNYELARPLEGSKISFGQTNIFVKFNKGLPEEMEEALAVSKRYRELGSTEAAVPYEKGMRCVEIVAKAERIVKLMDMPDEKELYVTAVAVGDVVFAGFPGEPFTDIGRSVKSASKFTVTIPACCANGYEGYYPMASAFEEGGYEALTSRYVCGTAEKLIETSTELINNF
ncbi:MAG: neutral/alkaline non-lysosomal ceramidase N-terminal domain-containing protein [Oscillospiraceae bacterium]|nr:neutral/alkaline non-lysosomal ceramidase N-terminal domain-containing protein [Oscillospiraceae bacterium]MBQ9939379.1 neutral/alkaline non-lysosomal ceramidase N-terminal domain-containing protein [Oscillospiraceae bacterium]